MIPLLRSLRPAVAGPLLFLSCLLPVHASVVGTSALNADGSYTYSYTVDNTAGLFDIAIWSLDFDFTTPDWDQNDTFIGGGVTVPDENWFAMAGTPTVGASTQDFISLTGGILVGTSVDGFSFTSWFAPGTVTFSEFDALGSDSAVGTTVGPSQSGSATVPEGPGPYAMMTAALILGAGLVRRKTVRTAAL